MTRPAQLDLLALLERPRPVRPRPVRHEAPVTVSKTIRADRNSPAFNDWDASVCVPRGIEAVRLGWTETGEALALWALVVEVRV